jgi:hypothetical protein
MSHYSDRRYMRQTIGRRVLLHFALRRSDGEGRYVLRVARGQHLPLFARRQKCPPRLTGGTRDPRRSGCGLHSLRSSLRFGLGLELRFGLRLGRVLPQFPHGCSWYHTHRRRLPCFSGSLHPRRFASIVRRLTLPIIHHFPSHRGLPAGTELGSACARWGGQLIVFLTCRHLAEWAKAENLVWYSSRPLSSQRQFGRSEERVLRGAKREKGEAFSPKLVITMPEHAPAAVPELGVYRTNQGRG